MLRKKTALTKIDRSSLRTLRVFSKLGYAENRCEHASGMDHANCALPQSQSSDCSKVHCRTSCPHSAALCAEVSIEHLRAYPNGYIQMYALTFPWTPKPGGRDILVVCCEEVTSICKEHKGIYLLRCPMGWSGPM
jgi:hypothetical protein